MAHHQTEQWLSAGEISINLETPLDPRLNTYGVDAQVAGVAFDQQTGTGSEFAVAGPGAEIVVVHFKATFASFFSNDLDPSYQQMVFQVTLHSGSVSANLPGEDNTISNALDETVAVAIPKGAPATLSISMGGLLPQSFDLRALKRIGTSPAALYRDPTHAETTVQSNAVQSLNITTSAGPAAGQFGLEIAALAPWQPESTTITPFPVQAYLSLYFDYTNLKLADGTDIYPATLPGSAVQIVLPDGSTLPTTFIATGKSVDLLDGIYYALVPAGITSAKIVVNPGPSVQATDPNGDALTLDIPGPLTTSVTFPPPWTSAVSAPPIKTAPLAPKVGQGKSSTWVWVVIAAVVLALAGSGFLVSRRRRTWLPVRALQRPPRALPPATIALLSGGPRLALPPASPDISEPPQPSTAEARVVMIRLFGALEVEGLRKRITRKAVRRLLVCLAVSGGRPLTAEELSVGISDKPDRDTKVNSIQSYASILRSALPERTLPDAGRAGGYRLDPARVVVDLNALTSVADEPADRPGWPDRAQAALELVRDRPLVGGRWEGIEPAARLIEAGIEGLARNLCAHLLSTGNADGAERAVSKGLTAVPKSLGLWQDRLDAAADGSGYGLERAWTDAQKELGPDSALLLAHYQELRRRLGEQPAASV